MRFVKTYVAPVVGCLLLACNTTLPVGVDDADGPEATDAQIETSPVEMLDAGLPLETGLEPEPIPCREPDCGDCMDCTPSDGEYPFADLIDQARGDHPAWAHFIEVRRNGESIEFQESSYESDRVDFFPASTAKIFATTAAMELLNRYDLSLDTKATFYHWDGGKWVQDVEASMRDLVEDAVRCSSNEAHTLLLRFAGVDYLHQEFFIPENGFVHTRLMRGYHHSRPEQYVVDEPQRIVLEDNGTVIEREHEYSGQQYIEEDCADERVCTSARELAEHMRRLMFHESLPPAQQFEIRPADLDWFRYGDTEPVLNDKAGCGGSTRAALSSVLPDADLYHKGGWVTGWSSTVDYVHDAATGTEYVVAIATRDSSTLRSLSRAVGLLAKGRGSYVTLDYLEDHVNPIRATTHVFTRGPSILELVVRAQGSDQDLVPLPGARLEIEAGGGTYDLRSHCLDEAITYDIFARLTPTGGPAVFSEPHYVIVDPEQPCDSRS